MPGSTRSNPQSRQGAQFPLRRVSEARVRKKGEAPAEPRMGVVSEERLGGSLALPEILRFTNRVVRSGQRFLALVVVLLLAGCGYLVGPAYQTEVRTVHVPIFTSDTFRRGVEFQLTEAVQKQIQIRTPFRLAKPPYAETRLTGHLVEIRKDILGESRFDDPRELQLAYVVQVTWEDLRSGQVLSQQRIAISPDAVHLMAHAQFAPEVGQSLATGTQQAVDRLARQIVEMMEIPW